MAEFQGAADRDASSEKAKQSYESASEIAGQSLPPTHPIRLGECLRCVAQRGGALWRNGRSHYLRYLKKPTAIHRPFYNPRAPLPHPTAPLPHIIHLITSSPHHL